MPPVEIAGIRQYTSSAPLRAKAIPSLVRRFRLGFHIGQDETCHGCDWRCELVARSHSIPGGINAVRLGRGTCRDAAGWL